MMINDKLLVHLFNKVAETKDESKDVIKAIELSTISRELTPNGMTGKFAPSENERAVFEQKNGKFTLLDNWLDLKKDDELEPFELLVKKRFNDNRDDALKFLHSEGWHDRPIGNLIFTNNKFDAIKTAEYLKAYGFIRISQNNRDELKVFFNDFGILRDFNIKSDTVNFLSKRIKDPYLINKLFSVRGAVVAVWQLLEGVDYDLQLDSRNVVYLPFKGKVLKVTADKMEFVEYDKLKLFRPVESMRHDFDYTDDIGMYEKFLSYAIAGSDKPNEWTDTDKHNIKAVKSSIGYSISTYKDPSLNKAIIYSDFGATGEVRNGRRGKSLIFEALKIFRLAITKGENEYDPTYRHRNAEIEEFHKLMLLDDVAKNFNYYSLFTSITGALSCERKGKSAIEIPFVKSPKWIMTTNFVIPFKGDEQSIIARYFEYQLKPFWNAEFTPRKYFDANFFSEDWSSSEWNKFFSFIVQCVQLFLSEGLIEMNIDRKESIYQSYIGSNEMKVEEMERIFKELQFRKGFRVSDFVKEHLKNVDLRYHIKPIWNEWTAKRDIELWIDFNQLPYQYKQSPGGGLKQKSWVKIDSNYIDVKLDDDIDDIDDVEIVSDDEMPF